MIMAHETFVWVVAGLIVFVTGTNGIRDIFLLRRLLGDPGAKNRSDQIFGTFVGIFLLLLGFGGVIKYCCF